MKIALQCFAVTGLLVAAMGARAYDANELQRFAKTFERATEYSTPEFRLLMEQVTLEEDMRLLQIKLNDPERNSNGSLCQQHRDGCLGDPRFYRWGDDGSGIRQEVVFTARNGATLSGHVWASIDGPAKRPGVLINSGSVQAPEELWGWAGAVLARNGYVVMTWDPQGQGYSDTFGACSDSFPDLADCPDRMDGVPAQQNDVQPFYLGSQDALDFFVSTPDAPYVPRDSRNGESRAGKQQRRVAEGFNTAWNPLWELLDPARIGVAGNSKGAGSATQLAMADERIGAIVGWDNLGGATDSEAFGPGLVPRVPGLGISNDYGLDVVPHTQKPDPQSKLRGFLSHVEHGVDSAQINIRGGTHFESAYIPNVKFGASLYGLDLTAWYTLAWFDKYLKADPTADDRLLSDRWRCDPRSAAIEEELGHAMDGVGDANLISIDLESHIAITTEGGSPFVCDDLRGGCGGRLRADQLPHPYSYLDAAFRTQSTPTTAFAGCPGAASTSRVAHSASGGGQAGVWTLVALLLLGRARQRGGREHTQPSAGESKAHGGFASRARRSTLTRCSLS